MLSQFPPPPTASASAGHGRPRVAIMGQSREARGLSVGASRRVPRAGETQWVPLGDTGEWRVTPRDCVRVYYREIVHDARGWCVAV